MLVSLPWRFIACCSFIRTGNIIRTAYQSSPNMRQFESIKKGHSVPTIYFLIIYTDKFLESDRLRECKNEETDNAKRGKQTTNISENGVLWLDDNQSGVEICGWIPWGLRVEKWLAHAILIVFEKHTRVNKFQIAYKNAILWQKDFKNISARP